MTTTTTELTHTGSIPYDDIIENYKEKSLQRDFRSLYISKKDWTRVIENTGESCLLFTTSSEISTEWYFYHSDKKWRYYIMWFNTVTGSCGCRTDYERIELLENR